MFFFCKTYLKSYASFCPFEYVLSFKNNRAFISVVFSGITFSYLLKLFYNKKYIHYDSNSNSNSNSNSHTLIPYEQKFIKEFNEMPDNDFQCGLSEHYIKTKCNELVANYKQDLYALQQEYTELQNLYDNSESDHDEDFDFNNDEPVKIILEKIYRIKKLLDDENNIMNETKVIFVQSAKEKLMKNLENNFILENTPVGNVIMVFNSKTNGFHYFSDKSISNKYLETVCRKYCIQFKCKSLFSNIFINNGKLCNFSFLKNEIKHDIKKNSKMSFSDFKKQFALF